MKGFSREEPQVFEVMRRFALSLSGLPASVPWPVPETPQPLPTPNSACSDSRTLRWRGSAWALSYTIQRRPIGAKTWSIIAKDVSDGVESGSVLFVDRGTLVPQVRYEYAIQAHGRDGLCNGDYLVLRPL